MEDFLNFQGALDLVTKSNQHVRGWQWEWGWGGGTVSAGKGLRLLSTALLEELCAQPRRREFQAAKLVSRHSSLGSLGEHLTKALVPTLAFLGSCGTFKGGASWGCHGSWAVCSQRGLLN